MNDILELLTSIDPTKEFLKFLGRRFQSDKYRGNHYSQHGRYDIEYIWNILNEINIEMKNENLDKLQIRTQDISIRPEIIAGEESYSRIVNNLQNILGKTTQDSFRKQYLLEMHRMGLIDRYNKNGDLITNPWKQSKVKYVSITDLGMEMLNANNILKKQIIFQNCLDVLFRGFTEKLINYLIEIDEAGTNRNWDYITQDEYTLFLSFLDNELEVNGEIVKYDFEKLKEYIIEYRHWSGRQKEHLIETIKEWAVPSNFESGNSNKKDKKDWHNFINETQQIFSLLNQTAIFTVDNQTNKLTMVFNKDKFFTEKDKISLKRNVKEKRNYFDKHGVVKHKGYELHHIIPLLRARNNEEFFLLDKWQNMLYIDAKKHSVITQEGSKHINLDFNENNVVLKRFDDDKIDLIKNDNVFYNITNQTIMKKTNNDLLKMIEYINEN
ncbi:hypothetical protein [Mycoplasma zalophidermidis]|uniref:hypothetical protein n=1 Tax=Mycoplasma zalophidermidis TaxID=398174 RepID=UPI00215CBD9A|nr:hypothetical protein [Mycoplasma zalophidermidis]MCR8966394.1 hypothetical protein [Mycoplasma zalophidermidis]